MSCMSEGSSSRPDLLAGQLYKHRGTLVPIKPFNQVLLDLREGKVEAAEALDRRSVGASALVRYFVSLPQKDAQHTPMEACLYVRNLVADLHSMADGAVQHYPLPGPSWHAHRDQRYSLYPARLAQARSTRQAGIVECAKS